LELYREAKNLKTYIWKTFLVIGVTFLLLEAGVVLGIGQNQGIIQNKSGMIPIPTPTGRYWYDNFDSYETGSPLHGQGGWAAWDNNAAATGYVSDAQARSSPNSLEIQYYSGVAADMVHEYSGVNSDTWIYTAWLYVPSSMTGTQFFILMNKYTLYSHVIQDWSLQVEFNAVSGYIRDFDNVGASLPLIKDTWMELRVEIDFEADIQTVFYGGTQFIQKSWKNGVSQGGQKNLACVDLYAGDNPSTPVYWDDLSLQPLTAPLTCDADGPYAGETGQAIQFTGSAEGGTPPYTWSWDFGDGETAATQNPTHIYTSPGVYDVTLTVTDANSNSASDMTTATITQASEPEIEIGKITGGKGVFVVIKNVGNAIAPKVSWSINLSGGILLKGRTQTGSIFNLDINAERTITSPVFGFGRVTITVTAGEKQKEATAFIFLFFVLNVK
jgi:PKD repeat protein